MGKMWRPTLRCDSAYKYYIESLNKITSLDKNQIMRLMMFIAAHSTKFKQIIEEYKNEGVTTFPIAPWDLGEDAFWLNQTYQPKSKRNGTIYKKIENEKVSIKKDENGVIKIKVSSLL